MVMVGIAKPIPLDVATPSSINRATELVCWSDCEGWRLLNDVHDDGTDGCRVCFAAREHATGANMQLLDGALLCVTEVFLPDAANRSMRALYYRNRGYAYEEIVKN
jgi:hypothetical protein